MQSVLDNVDSPEDLKRLCYPELERLASDLRTMIVETTSATGGHLASSLGAVELTVAILRALDAPEDKIIWDVGHQTYAYKILTGRKEEFHTLRQHGGISGFPRREESEYDVTDSGHAGSSVSHGLGLALARDLTGDDYSVLVVIGDGSMTSGVAYEAMNQAGHHLDSNMIIILNDNEMSISENVGGFASYLSRLRIKPGYRHLKEEITDALQNVPGLGEGVVGALSQLKESVTHALVPGMLFEDLGLKYVGPINGHDIREIEETIREAQQVEGPVLIHALTKKGRGYRHSESRPDEYHGVSAFDSNTGEFASRGDGKTYTAVFGETMVELAEKDPRIIAITAAMTRGTGLDSYCRRFPERFLDVGIAEQLGVNLAGGLALGGLKPVVAIYSTFLQRAVDQISQEICLQKLPVVFAVDRAGLVGADGATHHGYFDVSYLRMLPNMTVMAPGSAQDLEKMLRFALAGDAPVAIRFARGWAGSGGGVGEEELVTGWGETVRPGGEVVLLALGDMVSTALEVAGLLQEDGIDAGVVNARFAKPLDPDFIADTSGGAAMVVTLEDNVLSGGFGGAVLEVMAGNGIRVPVLSRGLPDSYVEHGTIAELREDLGLTPRVLAREIREKLGFQG